MNLTNSKLGKSAEITANLCIAIVALVGAAVLVKNYLLRSPLPTTEAKQPASPNGVQALANNAAPASAPAEGTQLSIKGVNWSESNETIVLALSKGCHFCSESAPFYQKLTRALAQRKDVRVVAVMPQNTDEGKSYLDGLGVPIAEVLQAPLNSIGVRGTPTVIMVDGTGTVKQSWIGRLSADKEAEVLNRAGL